MTLKDRFLRYVQFDTQSNDETAVTPSTDNQRVFALALKDELVRIGMEDVTIDDHSYLMATLPSNSDKPVPVIGFIAHLDTSPDMTGAHVKPRLVADYDGGDIILNAEQGVVLSPAEFPELLNYKSQTLIVTDGTTLLGADDKAGIAEIISAMEYLISHPEIKHGKIRIAFNPDEEIGLGAHKFDVEAFGAQWAYTMDGGEIGELEFENFNAASAKIMIQGRNVHPGYAKGKMINALLVAQRIISLFPEQQTPHTTSGYEGFFHLHQMSGTVDRAALSYIIRDHDRTLFEQRKQQVAQIVDQVNQELGADRVTIELKDQYYNMKLQVEPMQYIVDWAFDAMQAVGVTPTVKPIRGGTDGAQLSFKGLPCPNIFAGGLNFHGRYEFVPLESMEKAMQVIVKLAEIVEARS